MRKLFEKILFISMLISLSVNVNATCTNKELNDWASKLEPKFVLYSHTDEKYEDLNAAYVIGISRERNDVYFEITDGLGYTVKANYIEELKMSGVPCTTNLEEEKYIIKVYAKEESNCSNELLKEMTYTVPPYNDYIKSRYCENNPEHELCNVFKDTQDISWQDFNNIMEKYEESKNKTTINIIIEIITYVLCALIPFIIATIIYLNLKRKHIKKESDK